MSNGRAKLSELRKASEGLCLIIWVCSNSKVTLKKDLFYINNKSNESKKYDCSNFLICRFQECIIIQKVVA